MRTIEKQIKEAFKAGNKKAISNTTTDGESVWLHGNKIIERRENEVWASLAGWNTPTTRSRINNILGAGFHQKKGLPYLNDNLIDSSAWYRIQS